MDLIEGLKRFRMFQFEYSDAGVVYQNSANRMDRINSWMGICFFDPNVSLLQPRLVWGICTLFIYLYLAIESTYWYRNDVEKVILCIATHGFSIQMASKVYTFIVHKAKVVEINEMNLSYFKLDTTKLSIVQQALKSSAIISNILLTMTIIGYIILVGVIILGPAIFGATMSEKILPLGVELVHSYSWPAYSANLLFQINCAIYVALFTTSSDGTFILYLLTAIGQIDAILRMLIELNDLAKQNQTEERLSDQLRKILYQHQHHLQYMRKLEDLFNVYFMLAITSLYFCMSVSLAAFVLLNWYMGVLVFCFSSAQIFYMCFLGTTLESKNELLMKEAGSFDWYRLSVRNQKLALFFLEMTQNPIPFTAVMVKLNVETYLQVHKSVYSGLMLLMRIKE